MPTRPLLNGAPITREYIDAFLKRNPPGRSSTKIGDMDNFHALLIIQWLVEQLEEKELEFEKVNRSWFDKLSDWVKEKTRKGVHALRAVKI
jgi:hypothetical protein